MPKYAALDKRKLFTLGQLLIIAGLVLVLVAIAYFVIARTLSQSVNCEQQYTDAVKLLQDKSFNKAYTLLQPDATQCTTVSSSLSKENTSQSTKDKVQAVQYGYSIATAAFYAGGHTKQASQYATQALKTYNSMTTSEQEQILDY